MMKKISFFSVLILLILLYFNCHNRKISYTPQLPPVNSFTITDENVKAIMVDTPILTDSARLNRYYATKRFFFWQKYIKKINLPYKILLRAYSQQAEFFANNTWVWEYNLLYNSEEYSIRLYATVINDSIFWEGYYLTNNKEKLILQGKSDTINKGGYWIFYKNVFKPIKKIKIIWQNRYIVGTIFQKKIKIIDTNSLNFGNFLHICKLDTEQYQVRLQIYDGRPYKSYIKIDHYGYGMIKDYYYFLDSAWHCWNSHYLNINCSKN